MHVHEYRKYLAKPGKLEDLKARFRDHTERLFVRHHMKSLGYWEPVNSDNVNTENALLYILEHATREEAAANWAAFIADPDWKKAAQESEINGPLVEHIESIFLHPTDFSAIR